MQMEELFSTLAPYFCIQGLTDLIEGMPHEYGESSDVQCGEMYPCESATEVREEVVSVGCVPWWSKTAHSVDVVRYYCFAEDPNMELVLSGLEGVEGADEVVEMMRKYGKMARIFFCSEARLKEMLVPLTCRDCEKGIFQNLELILQHPESYDSRVFCYNIMKLYEISGGYAANMGSVNLELLHHLPCDLVMRNEGGVVVLQSRNISRESGTNIVPLILNSEWPSKPILQLLEYPF